MQFLFKLVQLVSILEFEIVQIKLFHCLYNTQNIEQTSPRTPITSQHTRMIFVRIRIYGMHYAYVCFYFVFTTPRHRSLTCDAEYCNRPFSLSPPIYLWSFLWQPRLLHRYLSL